MGQIYVWQPRLFAILQIFNGSGILRMGLVASIDEAWPHGPVDAG